MNINERLSQPAPEKPKSESVKFGKNIKVSFEVKEFPEFGTKFKAGEKEKLTDRANDVLKTLEKRVKLGSDEILICEIGLFPTNEHSKKQIIEEIKRDIEMNGLKVTKSLINEKMEERAGDIKPHAYLDCEIVSRRNRDEQISYASNAMIYEDMYAIKTKGAVSFEEFLQDILDQLEERRGN